MTVEVQILLLAAVIGLLIVTPWGRPEKRGARTFPDPTYEPPEEVTPRAARPSKKVAP